VGKYSKAYFMGGVMLYLTLLLACLGICRAVRDLAGPDDPDYDYPEYYE